MYIFHELLASWGMTLGLPKSAIVLLACDFVKVLRAPN
jgi:hypothetical protein